jgi:hypothetical protein
MELMASESSALEDLSIQQVSIQTHSNPSSLACLQQLPTFVKPYCKFTSIQTSNDELKRI